MILCSSTQCQKGNECIDTTITGCLTCIDASTCTECSDGFYFDPESITSSSCPECGITNCKSCSLDKLTSEYQCYKCINNIKLDTSSYTCNSCEIGYHLDSSSKMCIIDCAVVGNSSCACLKSGSQSVAFCSESDHCAASEDGPLCIPTIVANCKYYTASGNNAVCSKCEVGYSLNITQTECIANNCSLNVPALTDGCICDLNTVETAVAVACEASQYCYPKVAENVCTTNKILNCAKLAAGNNTSCETCEGGFKLSTDKQFCELECTNFNTLLTDSCLCKGNNCDIDFYCMRTVEQDGNSDYCAIKCSNQRVNSCQCVKSDTQTTISDSAYCNNYHYCDQATGICALRECAQHDSYCLCIKIDEPAINNECDGNANCDQSSGKCLPKCTYGQSSCFCNQDGNKNDFNVCDSDKVCNSNTGICVAQNEIPCTQYNIISASACKCGEEVCKKRQMCISDKTPRCILQCTNDGYQKFACECLEYVINSQTGVKEKKFIAVPAGEFCIQNKYISKQCPENVVLTEDCAYYYQGNYLSCSEKQVYYQRHCLWNIVDNHQCSNNNRCYCLVQDTPHYMTGYDVCIHNLTSNTCSFLKGCEYYQIDATNCACGGNPCTSDQICVKQQCVDKQNDCVASSNCMQCKTGSDSDQCTQCDTGRYLGKLSSSAKTTCLKCEIANCSTCFNNSLCFTCRQGYYYVPDLYCLASDPTSLKPCPNTSKILQEECYILNKTIFGNKDYQSCAPGQIIFTIQGLKQCAFKCPSNLSGLVNYYYYYLIDSAGKPVLVSINDYISIENGLQILKQGCMNSQTPLDNTCICTSDGNHCSEGQICYNYTCIPIATKMNQPLEEDMYCGDSICMKGRYCFSANAAATGISNGVKCLQTTAELLTKFNFGKLYNKASICGTSICLTESCTITDESAVCNCQDSGDLGGCTISPGVACSPSQFFNGINCTEIASAQFDSQQIQNPPNYVISTLKCGENAAIPSRLQQCFEGKIYEVCASLVPVQSQCLCAIYDFISGVATSIVLQPGMICQFDTYNCKAGQKLTFSYDSTKQQNIGKCSSQGSSDSKLSIGAIIGIILAAIAIIVVLVIIAVCWSKMAKKAKVTEMEINEQEAKKNNKLEESKEKTKNIDKEKAENDEQQAIQAAIV